MNEFYFKKRLSEAYILLSYYYISGFFCPVEYNLNQSFRLFIYCSCQKTKPTAHICPVYSHFSYSSPCLMLILRSRRGYIYTVYIYTPWSHLSPGTRSEWLESPLIKVGVVWKGMALPRRWALWRAWWVPVPRPSPPAPHRASCTNPSAAGAGAAGGGRLAGVQVNWCSVGCSCMSSHWRQLWLFSWDSRPAASSIKTLSETAFRQGLWAYSKSLKAHVGLMLFALSSPLLCPP